MEHGIVQIKYKMYNVLTGFDWSDNETPFFLIFTAFLTYIVLQNITS